MACPSTLSTMSPRRSSALAGDSGARPLKRCAHARRQRRRARKRTPARAEEGTRAWAGRG
eukprot:2316576-Pleurochrysis_carterae.AAC.1